MTTRKARIQKDVTEALLRAAPDHVDRLDALAAFIAADLRAAKFTSKEATGWLLRITALLDKTEPPNVQPHPAPDPRLKGMDVRHDGRTVEFTAYVNTDASEADLRDRAMAIRDAARGPGSDMVLVTACEVPPEQSETLWAEAMQMARNAAGEKMS